MIHQVIYVTLHSNGVNMAGFGEAPRIVNPWEIIKTNLENTKDHLVWVVTTDQLMAFLTEIRSRGLDKYLVIDHSKAGQGTTNRNYPDRSLRLKVFIMKGVGNV